MKAKIKPVGRRLFVSRADASIRRLLSEAAVIRALKPLGFEAVALEGTPFAQQVESFGQADCVVGVHGAGLSNIAFMRPGGTVVEILTPGRLWRTYRGVAARSGLTYHPYLGRSAGLELQNDSDVDLDADHFTAFVTEIAPKGSPGGERDGSLRSLRN